jgi:hypothetical protein
VRIAAENGHVGVIEILANVLGDSILLDDLKYDGMETLLETAIKTRQHNIAAFVWWKRAKSPWLSYVPYTLYLVGYYIYLLGCVILILSHGMSRLLTLFRSISVPASCSNNVGHSNSSILETDNSSKEGYARNTVQTFLSDVELEKSRMSPILPTADSTLHDVCSAATEHEGSIGKVATDQGCDGSHLDHTTSDASSHHHECRVTTNDERHILQLHKQNVECSGLQDGSHGDNNVGDDVLCISGCDFRDAQTEHGIRMCEDDTMTIVSLDAHEPVKREDLPGVQASSCLNAEDSVTSIGSCVPESEDMGNAPTSSVTCPKPLLHVKSCAQSFSQVASCAMVWSSAAKPLKNVKNQTLRYRWSAGPSPYRNLLLARNP